MTFTPTAKVQGTAHLYGTIGGVGAIASATVNSVRIKSYPGVKASVQDEIGRTIERRYDDQFLEADIEVTIEAGFTVVTGDGSLFAFNSVNYEIQSVTQGSTKKGYQTVTLSVLNSAQITPS